MAVKTVLAALAAIFVAGAVQAAALSTYAEESFTTSGTTQTLTASQFSDIKSWESNAVVIFVEDADVRFSVSGSSPTTSSPLAAAGSQLTITGKHDTSNFRFIWDGVTGYLRVFYQR